MVNLWADTQVDEGARTKKKVHVCSVPVFFKLIWSEQVVWNGVEGRGWEGYKGETNSSLGHEGKHNYVQLSS